MQRQWPWTWNQGDITLFGADEVQGKGFAKACKSKLPSGQFPFLENVQQIDQYIQKMKDALAFAINGCVYGVPHSRLKVQRAADEELGPPGVGTITSSDTRQ
ncbi:hypothetical protein BHE90_007969 [Fusarium euwallaceae]|uniref:Uncharacterized protein n=1 Tax=Fusarium euwallaceae TaxID=1147111 RepID=A0A430LPC2_9HYPO|nr:hypothetical protein BHE90_007969 [Fusarium euwallaceae]